MEIEPRCECCGAEDRELRRRLDLDRKERLTMPDVGLRSLLLCALCREAELTLLRRFLGRQVADRAAAGS